MASILIVDDSVAARNATAALLRADGHGVTCADNAWRGLTILESMPIDLVILDLALPGLNGAGFLKDVQAGRHQGVPVIVVSAMEVDEQLWGQMRPQVREWLVKGKNTGEELLAGIRAALPVAEAITSAA
jgi:DNA-binding response OmpR family regulator